MQQPSFGGSLDGNAYIHRLVRDTVHAAVPKCLIAAASEFQLALSEEAPRFDTYIDQAIQVATRLQAVRFSKRGGEAGDAAGATERPGNKPKSSSKPTTPRGKGANNTNNGTHTKNGGGGNSPAGLKREAIAVSAAAELLKQTDNKLLKELDRCQTCGWLRRLRTTTAVGAMAWQRVWRLYALIWRTVCTLRSSARRRPLAARLRARRRV